MSINIDELAYRLYEREQWGGPIPDDYPNAEWAKGARTGRKKLWDELPDDGRDGPCNVDCNCDYHHWSGKRDYRELAQFVLDAVELVRQQR